MARKVGRQDPLHPRAVRVEVVRPEEVLLRVGRVGEVGEGEVGHLGGPEAFVAVRRPPDDLEPIEHVAFERTVAVREDDRARHPPASCSLPATGGES